MSKNCNTIHQWFNGMKKFTFPFDKKDIPENGIYILFEKREFAHSTNRIVRIGTHTGHNQLRSRLFQHFLKENKDRSIFRKNIGRALLNRDKDSFLEKWELDLTTRNAKDRHSDSVDFDKQKEIEKRVTKFIQDNFSFVVFQIDDKDKRLYFESRIISIVSLCEECKPSENWLGNYSPKEKIRKSGLWIVNELWKTPLTDEDIIELKQLLNVD
jgi:CRISPR/Cas system-associated endoribonuclease Cas2